jgi:hypothetical protein
VCLWPAVPDDDAPSVGSGFTPRARRLITIGRAALSVGGLVSESLRVGGVPASYKILVSTSVSDSVLVDGG